MTISKPTQLTVNYDQPLKDLIADCKLDWVNEDITIEHFPKEKKGTKTIEVAILKYGEYKNHEYVLKDIKQAGWNLANVQELLSYVKAGNFDDYLLALGQHWEHALGYQHFPCLLQDDRVRYVDLAWMSEPDHEWHVRWGFFLSRELPLESGKPETSPLNPLVPCPRFCPNCGVKHNQIT